MRTWWLLRPRVLCPKDVLTPIVDQAIMDPSAALEQQKIASSGSKLNWEPVSGRPWIAMIAESDEQPSSGQHRAITKLDALARRRHDPFVMGGNQDPTMQSLRGKDDLVHYQLR